MKEVHVLDCTLRDGGYCNSWNFGFDNIKKVTKGLMDANVDIVECGFLTNKINYCSDSTKFTKIEQITNVLPNNKDKLFVAMINYGEYDINDIPPRSESTIDGIRVAFSKKNLVPALDLCRKIKDKGYLVFVQAMVSLSYTDEEFLSLINEANSFEPYAFYIVDSFGMMKGKDLVRLFYMIEHNLNPKIWIGFHSHNNMQLAYSNAQLLVNIQTNRNIIIDSSIMGMGRGAGNLNTELFLGFLNESINKNYSIVPLLEIIDKIISNFYSKNYWGYSLPNYISAKNNAHPNYAGYLDSKKTLTFENINEIFEMMDDEKKVVYDQNYIEDLYLKYQEKDSVQDSHLQGLKDEFINKTILLIAPGPSAECEREKIIAAAQTDNTITFSVNFDYGNNIIDYIFVSNIRRFEELSADKYPKTIITSNITTANNVFLKVRYGDLINNVDNVKDNSVLMIINFLISLGVKNILLAGIDGYTLNVNENYAYSQMNLFNNEEQLIQAKNTGLVKVLKEFMKKIDIKFVTKPKFLNFEND